ncbi:MAG TPA: hypothetical protein VIY86_10940, partial [Pirellulaceae bacterium]
MRLDALRALEDAEPMCEAVRDFHRRFPSNPVACGGYAALRVTEAGLTESEESATSPEEYGEHLRRRNALVREAIAVLQDGLEASVDSIHLAIYAAFRALASSLYQLHYFPAALEHAFVAARLAPEDDPSPGEVLEAILVSAPMPLLFKRERIIRDLPEATPWKKAFDVAARLSRRAHWRQALDGFETLHAEHGDQPAILKGILLNADALGHTQRATEVLRRIADVTDDSWEATECEALALQQECWEGHFDRPFLEFSLDLADGPAALEQLRSHPRYRQTVMSISRADNDDPPPKVAIVILDRPLSDTLPENVADLPLVLALAYYYGKETDRPARIRWMDIAEDGEEVLGILRADLADLAQGVQQKFVNLSAGSAVGRYRQVYWGIKDRADIFRRLNPQFARRFLLELWINQPHPFLDGKTPLQVARDPSFQRRLQSMILLLETDHEHHFQVEDLESLRTLLGLPGFPTSYRTEGAPHDLSIARLGRLDVEPLSNEELVQYLAIAFRCSATSAMYRLCGEALRRSFDAR